MGVTPTWVDHEWNEYILNDPIFNKKLRDKSDFKKVRPDTEAKNENILLEGGLDMNLGSFLNGDEDEQ